MTNDLVVSEKKRKAIEPTSIDKIGPEVKFGNDMPSAGPVDPYSTLTRSTLSNFMRLMGWTRHPHECSHYRKTMYLGSSVWICKDCGTRL